MVGWNIEIMFAIAGIVFYYMCPENRSERILGLRARWFWAIAFSAFCVLVECVLNIGGLLVWEYPFWNRSLAGIWLIFVFGYFEFFAAINLVPAMRNVRRRVTVIGIIYAVPPVMNVFGFAGVEVLGPRSYGRARTHRQAVQLVREMTRDERLDRMVGGADDARLVPQRGDGKRRHGKRHHILGISPERLDEQFLQAWQPTDVSPDDDYPGVQDQDQVDDAHREILDGPFDDPLGHRIPSQRGLAYHGCGDGLRDAACHRKQG